MSTLFDDSLPLPEPAPAKPRSSDPAVLLEGLNPQQRAAVTLEGSPLLIVAGAGSGKTRVLAHRIAYLLSARKAHPGSIIAITFTNKAAGEMKERVSALVGNRARVMWVSTFHSACVRILRREAKHVGLSSSFSIYDAADSQRLMTLVCRELDLDPKRHSGRALAAQVSNLKNELIGPLDFKPTCSCSARRIRTQAEWNVLTHMSRARPPTRAATRSFISPAALLVNVIARIPNGETRRLATR